MNKHAKTVFQSQPTPTTWIVWDWRLKGCYCSLYGSKDPVKGACNSAFGIMLLILYFRSYRAVFNRSLPSCFEPHYESKAKCKAFHMKISFVCIMNEI